MNCYAFQLKTNHGHGVARRASIKLSSTNIIALMDSDDISDTERFFKQIYKFDEGYDIVGGQISEFILEEDKIYSYRNVALNSNEIKKDLKKRCPFNQVTVAFKKDKYYESGGYIDWYCEEDYYLWIRMIETNCACINLPDVLVNVRCGKDAVRRRAGIKYFKSEKALQKLLLKKKMISFPRYCFNVFKRFIGELIVAKLFPSLFIKIAHSDKNKYENNNTNGKITNTPFSVCMCVYNGDDPANFEKSVRSIFEQSLKPKEIILVIDGPINNKLRQIVLEYFGEIREYEVDERQQ